MAFKVLSCFMQKLLYFKNSLGMKTEGREEVNSKVPRTQNTKAELKFDQAEKRQEPISKKRLYRLTWLVGSPPCQQNWRAGGWPQNCCCCSQPFSPRWACWAGWASGPHPAPPASGQPQGKCRCVCWPACARAPPARWGGVPPPPPWWWGAAPPVRPLAVLNIRLSF